MPLATLCFTGFSRDDQAKAQQMFAQANSDSGGRFELASEAEAQVRGPAGARALALHMLEAVRKVGAEVSGGGVSASIGYALAPSDAQHPLKLLQAADDAMYAAKRLGKDRVQHGPLPTQPNAASR